MFLRRPTLKNWRNVQHADIDLIDANDVLGANASRKPDLLDASRFLRDVSKAKGVALFAEEDACESRGRLMTRA